MPADPVRHNDDYPGSMADPAVVAHRQALLGEPHVMPLVRYVRELSAQGRGHIPEFDPLDGGIHAKLLFLFEKPGRKTFPPKGSGFISRNNNDPTARAVHKFMLQAEVPRHGVVLWNTVPWWNGTIAITGAEKRSGAAEIRALLALLPELRGVVLAGNLAWQFGAPKLLDSGLKLTKCVHPSLQARNGPNSRAGWLQLPEIWRGAWKAVA
jgi:hypothetical protein